jgi:hypothetical protein
MQVAIPGLVCFALLLLLARRTRMARGFRYGVAPGSVMLMVTIIASCGSGTGGGQRTGTEPGSYTITVNAFTQSNTTGTPDATATVDVTVT